MPRYRRKGSIRPTQAQSIVQHGIDAQSENTRNIPDLCNLCTFHNTERMLYLALQ
jgi:hypothetical protein